MWIILAKWQEESQSVGGGKDEEDERECLGGKSWQGYIGKGTFLENLTYDSDTVTVIVIQLQ